MNPHSEQHEHLDSATSQRLAKLGQQPIDTSALEKRLDAAMSESPAEPLTLHLRRWLSPVAGVAASLLIVVGLYLAISSGGGQAQAAIVELSQLHHDIVAGRIPLTPAETVEQANTWIADQAESAPQLPADLGQVRVQSCCLADVQGDLVAVAVLQVDKELITLVVAEAPNFAHEMGTVIEIDGRRYFGHELNGVNMMMANLGDRWLCVMGDLGDERLSEIAAEVRF